MTNNNEGNKQLLRYAGLAMQFLVGIGIGVFIGLKVDKWLNLSIPLLVWLLPLLILCGIIYKIVKDTAAKK
ncbi:MAG: AtpZ/AtpI family protein [Bacteroidota bacterium]|nr:AtpZ/AtpI family protein [Bacteroidota bacterium]